MTPPQELIDDLKSNQRAAGYIYHVESADIWRYTTNPKCIYYFILSPGSLHRWDGETLKPIQYA